MFGAIFNILKKPLTWIIGTAGAAIGAGAVAAFHYFRNKSLRRKSQKQLEEQKKMVFDLQKELDKKKLESEVFQARLAEIRKNNDALLVQVNSLVDSNQQNQGKQRELEITIDQQNLELQDTLRQKATLQRQLDERGGCGLKTSFNYTKYYYSSKDINNCLQLAVKERLGGFKPGYKFLLQEQNSGIVCLLPSAATGNNLIHNFEILNVLHESLDIKIIFPYLHDQHWHTTEVIIKKLQNGYQVVCLMHDPRGGGEMPVVLFESIKQAITSLLDTLNELEIEFIKLPSPYQSCRQSKVDKFSCGPIVAKEIELRITDKSLDRNIPYQYGASELVEEQQDSLSSELINSRVHFLNDLGSSRYTL